jgi:excisionase family DNA binding protein
MQKYTPGTEPGRLSTPVQGTRRPKPNAHAPILLSREEAAAYIGIGTTKFDELVRDGRMPKARRIDGRKLWLQPELETAAFALPIDGEPETSSVWDRPEA